MPLPSNKYEAEQVESVNPIAIAEAVSAIREVGVSSTLSNAILEDTLIEAMSSLEDSIVDAIKRTNVGIETLSKNISHTNTGIENLSNNISNIRYTTTDQVEHANQPDAEEPTKPKKPPKTPPKEPPKEPPAPQSFFSQFMGMVNDRIESVSERSQQNIMGLKDSFYSELDTNLGPFAGIVKSGLDFTGGIGKEAVKAGFSKLKPSESDNNQPKKPPKGPPKEPPKELPAPQSFFSQFMGMTNDRIESNNNQHKEPPAPQLIFSEFTGMTNDRIESVSERSQQTTMGLKDSFYSEPGTNLGPFTGIVKSNPDFTGSIGKEAVKVGFSKLKPSESDNNQPSVEDVTAKFEEKVESSNSTIVEQSEQNTDRIVDVMKVSTEERREANRNSKKENPFNEKVDDSKPKGFLSSLLSGVVRVAALFLPIAKMLTVVKEGFSGILNTMKSLPILKNILPNGVESSAIPETASGDNGKGKKKGGLMKGLAKGVVKALKFAPVVGPLVAMASAVGSGGVDFFNSFKNGNNFFEALKDGGQSALSDATFGLVPEPDISGPSVENTERMDSKMTQSDEVEARATRRGQRRVRSETRSNTVVAPVNTDNSVTNTNTTTIINAPQDPTIRELNYNLNGAFAR